MHVDWCENGQKGLETLQASMPGYYDLVLMDVRMPVMDGYAATKAIRKLERPDLKNIPIIAMTANAFEEDIKEAEAAGMNDYATKPINPPVLFATLAKYIK
jgi:CheY-like chemotaxis protein